MGSPVLSSDRARLFSAALIVLLLVVCMLFLLRPVRDHDFFWHLKTGEWIWENRSLPVVDPFAHTTPVPPEPWARFILTSYWLSQIMYYLSFSAAGFAGIFWLRFLLTGLLLLLLFKRRHGDTMIFSAILLAAMLFILGGYPMERPQIFSFLCFAALLLVLERLKARPGDKKWLAALPALMLLWSNLHGGHAVGQLVLVFFLVSEGLACLKKGRGSAEAADFRLVAAAVAAGLAASLFNPNTYHGTRMMLGVPAILKTTNLEYQSSVWAFRTLNDRRMLLFWSVLGLALLSLFIGRRNTSLFEAGLIIAAGLASLATIRLIPFFLIAAAPSAGRLLSGTGIAQRARPILVACAVAAALWRAQGEPANIAALRSGQLLGRNLPAHAADFILRADIRGNLFNTHLWGGYLIWRLGPDRKVFIDGRSLSVNAYQAWHLVESASQEVSNGKPYWKDVLDQTQVNCIVIPLVDFLGRPLPLLSALANDRDWEPVYLERNELVFLRNSPENRELLKYYAIPREIFLQAANEELRRMTGGR